MKRKITRVDGKEFCTIEIELRERDERGMELSICGVHGHIMSDDDAQEQALEYWASFFEENPDERRAMNERFGTEFTNAEDAAQFVLDSDGQYHGLDVMQEDDGDVFVGTSFGQIREELERFFPEATPYFKWHLNGMNAGCEHQDELGWGHGRTVALSRDDATATQIEAIDSLRDERVKREREKELKILFTELTTRDRVITFLSKYLRRNPTIHEVNMVTIHDTLDGVLKSRLNKKERRDISSAFDRYLNERIDIPVWKGSVFEDSLGAPCPVCGYRYGTQWLHRELPADVIEWANTFGETDG
jgi:hypothetical protein